MKRCLSFITAFLLIIALAGCGNSGTDNSKEQETAVPSESTQTETSDNNTDESQITQVSPDENNSDEPSEQDDIASGSDILVVYFSRTGEQYGVGVIDEGNTAVVAQMIAEQTGADTYEILPADDHYPMTYNELTDVAKQEQNQNARPAYEGDVPDLSQYNVIFIGAPVWWGDWPMICYTFFENEDLSGKTLYPFSTHAGSGLSGFDQKLSSAVPDSTVGEGLAVAGTDCQNDREGVRNKVSSWLEDLEF